MPNTKKLNLVCVVTGGSGRVGLAIANMFLENHASVFLLASKNSDIKTALAKLNNARVQGIVCDVTKIQDIKKATKRIIKIYNRIDVLINAAGVFRPFGGFDKVPMKGHLEPIEVNLIGTMNMCHCIIPYMRKNKFGRIVNFSGGGVGGDIVPVFASSYYVSKGAVVFFTEVLADELKDYGITVNAVLPGQILTKSTKKAFKLSRSQLGPVLWKATQSLKETGGNTPAAVVNLIKFLAFGRSAKIYGRLLSAKWDNIDDLLRLKERASYKYKLRRIEGKIYDKKI